MGISFLFLLAVVWALFGLWCFLHGSKFGLLLIGLIVGALLVVSLFPASLAQYFGYVNMAAELLGNKKGLINTKPANLTVILLLAAVLLAALLGLLKVFRGRHSVVGFFLGLLNGYIFTAYTLAALLPQLAFLPLPIKIQGLTPVQLSSAVNIPPGRGFLAEMNAWLGSAVKLNCSSSLIILLIIGFILLVVFTGGRGGKKG